MNNIIEMKNVKKIYRMGELKVNALNGIDISIKKGEFISIMGPSGSGKSTAVNMIGCLDVPTKGKVFLEKQDISCEVIDLRTIRPIDWNIIFNSVKT